MTFNDETSDDASDDASDDDGNNNKECLNPRAEIAE
jgi:hypothetical protein